MTKNRMPGAVWMMRPTAARSRSNGFVRTAVDDYISIGHWGDLRIGSQSMVLSRADARLLAKRINECLDKTAKR